MEQVKLFYLDFVVELNLIQVKYQYLQQIEKIYVNN